MVDPLAFREHNPSYSSPLIGGAMRHGGATSAECAEALLHLLGGNDSARPGCGTDKPYEPQTMTDYDFLICGATVLCFNFDKRVWGMLCAY